MRFIRDQYQLQKRHGYSREVMEKIYPFYFSDTTKKKILLVNPCINRFELFTLIGPAFYLSAKSQSITCMITGMEPDKREFEDTTKDLAILKADVFYNDYVKLADVVILPFSYQPWAVNPDTETDSVYERIRKANPSTKIIFTVDFDFYDVPEGHYNYRTIKKSVKNIEENIRYADAIITGKAEAGEEQDEFPAYLREKIGLKGIRHIEIPSYFDRFHFADLDFTAKAEHKKGKKIRIGIPSDLFRRDDIEYFRDIYLWLQNQYKEEVELVFYGYHPDKEIDLRDARVGVIDNGEFFTKPKGKGKPGYFTNYQREKRNDYVYNFKNIYNLNCDVWLFLYAPGSKFWKHSPVDVDLLYAFYAELPVRTNYALTGFADMSSKEKIKREMKEFIEESIKTRTIIKNRYKQDAINYGYEIFNQITWNQENFQAVELQFMNFINY